MAISLNSIRANLTRETDGDWVEIFSLPGVALKARGYSYGPFQAAMSVVRARWIRSYGSVEGTPNHVASRDLGRLYAQHLLLDWRGFDEPFNPATIVDLLTDPEMRELRQAISYAAEKVAETETVFVEDAVKNSPPSSAGSSKTAA